MPTMFGRHPHDVRQWVIVLTGWQNAMITQLSLSGVIIKRCYDKIKTRFNNMPSSRFGPVWFCEPASCTLLGPGRRTQSFEASLAPAASSSWSGNRGRRSSSPQTTLTSPLPTSRICLRHNHSLIKSWVQVSNDFSVCPSVCLSVRLSVCLFVRLSVCLSVRLSVPRVNCT